MPNKRIINEINKFNSCSKYSNDYQATALTNNENITVVSIYRKPYSDYNYNSEKLCDFVCPNDYPFKPFKICSPIYSNYQKFLANIKYNNYNYNITWLLSVFTQKNLFNNHICFCCESVTCNNNWDPTILFVDGVSEYLKNKQLYKYLIHTKIHVYLEKIFLQTFGTFPRKITDLILKFIIIQ